MEFVPVVAVTAMIAWLAYNGRLATLEARPVRVAPAEPFEGALAIARARLARGEITPEDYDRISTILRD